MQPVTSVKQSEGNDFCGFFSLHTLGRKMVNKLADICGFSSHRVPDISSFAKN